MTSGVGPLRMSKETTKAGLLEAGTRLFLERGYNHSGVESILQTAGVPKGSFYHYFESKEDFGLQVLNSFASSYEEQIERFLADTSLNPLDRLRRLGEATVERLESRGCRNGCLVGNLCQEMADQNEAFRVRLAEIFAGWVDAHARVLREAQKAGEISEQWDARELAEFWMMGWQGAVLRVKTLRDIAPLKTFLNLMFAFVVSK